MIRLAQSALLHQMRQVSHGGNESVGESGHVAHARTISSLSDGPGVAHVQGQRLFAEDMLSMADGSMGDGCMSEVRRRNNHRIHILPLHDLLVVCRRHRDPGLLPSPFQRGRIGIAESADAHVRAKREAGKMILKRDAAAANDRDAKSFHVQLIQRRETMRGVLRNSSFPSQARYPLGQAVRTNPKRPIP